jgi:Tol biopolymer transport system component
MITRIVVRLPALAAILSFAFAAACADGGNCEGSPLMPVCEPVHTVAPAAEPHLVFQSNHEGSFQIYTMNSDGTGLRRLTDGPAVNVRPVWSPDGRRIAFASNRAGAFDVWVMDADGGNPRNLTSHPATDAFPFWSPDGRHIAFQSNRYGNSLEIVVMSSDGADVRQLTEHMEWNVQPRWSPDGRRIAFVSTRGGWGQIFLMNANGSGQRALTVEGVNQLPSWSPDGQYMAVQAMRAMDMRGDTSIAQIYVMRADGADQTNISRSGVNDTWPAWSRTGQVYFVSIRTGRRELWVMNSDGTGQRQLTNLGAVIEAPHAK